MRIAFKSGRDGTSAAAEHIDRADARGLNLCLRADQAREAAAADVDIVDRFGDGILIIKAHGPVLVECSLDAAADFKGIDALAGMDTELLAIDVVAMPLPIQPAVP